MRSNQVGSRIELAPVDGSFSFQKADLQSLGHFFFFLFQMNFQNIEEKIVPAQGGG